MPWTPEGKLIFYLCVHHQLGFQQHQHDFTGCGDFAPKQAHKPERWFGTPENLSTWTINNSMQVFYGHLVQCDNKNLTYCLFKPREFVLPFNIWANYSLRQLHSTIFILPRTSSCKPRHTGTTSSVAACGHQPPHPMMVMSWPQTDSARSRLEQNKRKTLLGQRKRTQETWRRNVNVWK